MFPFFKFAFLASLPILVFTYLVYLRRTRHALILSLQKQESLEKINTLKEGQKKNQDLLLALRKKKSRYISLKGLTEKLSKSLSLDEVGRFIVDEVSRLIGKSKVCLLYLIDEEKQELSLFSCKKLDSNRAIKSKKGDIFDNWILKHNQPLLIEDVRVDFRFDLEKIEPELLRPFSSLISTPLLVDSKLIGILRLDSQELKNYTSEDLRFLGVIADLAAIAIDNARLYQHTQNLAIHDALTGLFLKRYFLERLDCQMNRAREANEELSLLMLDIDYFKDYNDHFGHLAGDTLLRHISRWIKESSGAGNLISRFGGEEFAVLLVDIDKDKAKELAQNIRNKVEKEPIILRRELTSITVSLGVATYPEDAKNIEDLIKAADSALYRAKREGRNKVCCI